MLENQAKEKLSGSVSRPFKSWFIEGRLYDGIFIVLSPIVALLIIALVCEPRAPGGSLVMPSGTPSWLPYWVYVFIFMHVVLVFFRSHLNEKVFHRYPWRFTLIPLAAFALMAGSNSILMIMMIISIQWDEIHSVMQTFGFGRIYDSRLGNSATEGRWLDMGMCFVLEYLPHIILMTYLPYEDLLDQEDWLNQLSLQSVAEFIPSLRAPLYFFGFAYAAYYIWRYSALVRAGYRVSPAKLVLFAVSGFVNIYCVLRYTVVEAELAGNIYHATQYFAIVWISERENLSLKFRVPQWRLGKLGRPALFLSIVLLLMGIGVTRTATLDWPVLGALWLTCSLAHFWFDGFIWSVRRQDI